MRQDLETIFGRTKDILIGMVHVPALPGTAAHDTEPTSIISESVQQARILAEAGFDALLLENMHDTPYLLRAVGPEIVACMTAVTSAVRQAVDLPLGVQILAGANRDALAVAHASGAQFIRAEGFCFTSIADEGAMLTADAGPLLRYRRTINAEHIAVFADIRKKHSSHAMTADLSIADWAHGAEFMGADALIVTGDATGQSTDLSDVQAAKDACNLPIFVGSGISEATVRSVLNIADGGIIGSDLKKDGYWKNNLELDRCQAVISNGRRN